MKKFWKWMLEKGYGYNKDGKEPFWIAVRWDKDSPGGEIEFVPSSHQILIGYMIQYLNEKKVVFSMSFNKKPMFSVEDAYDFLVLKINEEG